MGFEGLLSDADRACMHERDDERDIEIDAHDEQLLDAIGDFVHAQMFAPGFDRNALTTWQRIHLQRALWAYMNDRLFYSEVAP